MTLLYAIEEIKKQLKELDIDGWLLYDFHRSNPLALQLLEIPEDAHLTRRLFYWIPKEGEPTKIFHAVEPAITEHLPGLPKVYSTYQQLHEALKETLRQARTIAMEYSPIPYISKVDGATIDLIRSFDKRIVTSAPLLQKMTSELTPEEIDSHRKACALSERVVQQAWDFIAENLQKGITEYDVQQYIVECYQNGGISYVCDAIVAVNENSANPHYFPSATQNSPLKQGDLLMIDTGTKAKNGIYSDITKMALIGRPPTEEEAKIFSIVREAQKQGTDLILKRWQNDLPIQGREVDEVCRKVITDAGYGPYFVHRTGHNIKYEFHGPGAHLDSFETLDDRELIPNTLSTIEPAIYLPNRFGIRLEYDILLLPNQIVEITGGIQESFYEINLKLT